MPRPIQKYVNKVLERRERTYPETATIFDIQGDRADIRIGKSPNVLHHILVAGDASKLQIGQTVSLKWENRPGSIAKVPIVIPASNFSGTTTSTSYTYPDNVTIEYSPSGLRVKQSSISMSHLSFKPSIDGHIHSDSLNAHGWQIDPSGTIYSSATFIHGDGQISLGLSPNILKLDGVHPTHRFWIGAVLPADASFSVTANGEVNATAGYIGGWQIERDRFSSDDGNAYIRSDVPEIGLEATAFGATGIWLGKDGGTYKFYAGNTNTFISWDGAALNVRGTVQSSGFVSGSAGWQIKYDGDAEFNNVIIRGTIKAAVFEYGEIQANAGTIGIFKSAGKLHNEFTSPGAYTTDFTFDVTNRYTSTSPFANGDAICIRTIIGGVSKELWAVISSQVDHTTYTTCTVTAVWSGDLNTTFPEGTPISDYGPSGTGLITLSADNTVGSSPNITMATATFIGMPPTINIHSRIGNLNGSYGISSDIFGAGFGQYGSASKTSILVDATNGIRMFNNTTAVFHATTAGNLYLGSDISDHSTTTISIFTAATTWNSESMEAGDMLIGDNDSGKANIKWDKSVGKLLFRGGTTNEIEIGTDGRLYAGAGAVSLYSGGILILSGSGDANTIKWQDGSSYPVGSIHSSTGTGYSLVTITAKGSTDAGRYGNLVLISQDGNGISSAQLTLHGNTDVIDAYGTLIANDGLKVTGLISQDSYVIRYVKTLTNISDNTATTVFTINTTNETSNDGGGYSCHVHAVIGHGITSSATDLAAKSFTAQFCRVIKASGTGVNSAVSEAVETASASTTPASKDISTVTMTVVETTEYANAVQFTVDLTGLVISTAQIALVVELVWWGFETPPTIT